MRVAVIQSNYIPWKGYFDIIHDVDLFIFHDDIQYTKNDWRNRNRIKTPRGTEWISIPVGPAENRRICDVVLPASNWRAKHWRTICQYYARAPFFDVYKGTFEEVFLGPTRWRNLSDLNQYLIKLIAREFLGIRTAFADSRSYCPVGVKQDRLLDLLVKAGATYYLSGPAAKAYIDPARFEKAGIQLEWKDYGGYPEYPQLFPPFCHEVTVLDLLFNTGPDAPYYIWGWRDCRTEGTAWAD